MGGLPHGFATFAAIEALEAEYGHPLRQVLKDGATVLDHRDWRAGLAHVERIWIDVDLNFFRLMKLTDSTSMTFSQPMQEHPI